MCFYALRTKELLIAIIAFSIFPFDPKFFFLFFSLENKWKVLNVRKTVKEILKWSQHSQIIRGYIFFWSYEFITWKEEKKWNMHNECSCIVAYTTVSYNEFKWYYVEKKAVIIIINVFSIFFLSSFFFFVLFNPFLLPSHQFR